MPNQKKGKKQGFQPITSNELASVLAYLAKAQAPLNETVVLSTKARKGHLKLRRGAQQVIPTIAVLALKYGVEMTSMPITDMTSMMEHGSRLREVLGAIVVFQKLLKDEILSSESGSWATATAMYAALRRAAKSRPELAAELSPVEAWFRRAHRGAKAPAASAAPTPAAADPIVTPKVTNGSAASAKATNGASVPASPAPIA